MSSYEVQHKVIPRDRSLTPVLLVGRVPTPCSTLKLKRRERDVVLRPDYVSCEMFLYLCQPIIRLQRVSSFCKPGRADSQELLKGGMLWTVTPLATLVLQQLHDRSRTLGNRSQSLSQHRVLRRWHVCSRHPVDRDIDQ